MLRFSAYNGEHSETYVQLYTYLNARNRCGVVGALGRVIKDLYIVPLTATDKIPAVLTPFNGPGNHS